jgi:streptogramin lyase
MRTQRSGFASTRSLSPAVCDGDQSLRRGARAAALILALVGVGLAGVARGQVITEFPVFTGSSEPVSIAAGPDGNLWFTEFAARQIGRITTAGVITEFSINGPGCYDIGNSGACNSQPYRIAAAPDGNLWFTFSDTNRIGRITTLIGRITTAGIIRQFAIPSASGGPGGIAAGPDGNLWFTEHVPSQIGRITTAGVITEFPIPTSGSGTVDIAAAPDGNLWFTESNANKIGRITTAGVITEFPIPSASSGPGGIAAGPDGNLWFTELNANQIGRITTAGVITEFPIPTSGSGAVDIAAAPDGNLWFTESNANKIGRITTGGVITEFPIPSASSGPGGIAAGPDGNLWFTEHVTNQIGRITTTGTTGPCVASATALCLNGGRFQVTAHWQKSDGASGDGAGVKLTGDSGYFWFFTPDNIEAVVKVLNGCGINDKYWVFAAGLTNVQVDVTVRDVQTDSVFTRRNPQGAAFAPIQDTGAFPASCP